jgi:transcriptional regulator with XRE-family HTH domain
MANWTEDLASTAEGRILLEQERVVLEATEALCRLMAAQRVTRADLARRLDVSPAYVTRLLSGSHNATLRTMATVFLALGRSLHIEHGPAGDQVRIAEGLGAAGGDPTLGEWHCSCSWTAAGGDNDRSLPTSCPTEIEPSSLAMAA